MRRPAAFGPALLFALVPLLAGCEESEIPIEPEGEPRFTNLVIDKLNATPDPDGLVDAGTVQYDVEASYQLSGGWEDEDLDAYLIINSFSNDVLVRTEVTEIQAVSGDQGTIRFDGAFTLANCGAVDQVLVYVDLSLASDPDVVADNDLYVVDAQTANVPC